MKKIARPLVAGLASAFLALGVAAAPQASADTSWGYSIKPGATTQDTSWGYAVKPGATTQDTSWGYAVKPGATTQDTSWGY